MERWRVYAASVTRYPPPIHERALRALIGDNRGSTLRKNRFSLQRLANRYSQGTREMELRNPAGAIALSSALDWSQS